MPQCIQCFCKQIPYCNPLRRFATAFHANQVFGIMIDFSDAVIGLQAPGSQQVIRDCPNTMQQPPRRHTPRYVSGATGLARILNIQLDAAKMMLDSGIIEEAVQRNGPQGIVIIEWEKAVQIWEAMGITIVPNEV